MDEDEMTDRQSGETQDEPKDPSSDEAPATIEAFESDEAPATIEAFESDESPEAPDASGPEQAEGATEAPTPTERDDSRSDETPDLTEASEEPDLTEASERSDETPERSETPDLTEAADLTEASDGSEPHEAFEPEPPVWGGSSPETLAPHEMTTQPVARESMTDQESDRAEAEASAEAAVDDGRGTALPGDADDRTPALDLASLHLRLGSLALARSELETFAGRGVLDATARIDLAEVRWRTGDLVGAGEVAREALAGGGEAVVALVVAAEAASALGRPSEARRLAGRAISLNGGPIDPIFAGMPRSSVWPADPAEPAPLSSTLFPPERSDLAIESEREDAALAGADDRGDDTMAADVSADDAEPGLWDLHEAAALAAGAAQPVPSDLDPSSLFDAGRAALETGDRSSAAVHLGLVVRMAPALAPAVLSLIGEPSDSGLQLVQGDAYRAVGHETEARRCYAAAIASASTPTTPSTVEWFGPPSTAEPQAAAWWLESLDESRPAAARPPSTPASPAVPAPPEPAPAPAEPESPHELAGPAEPEPRAESFEPELGAEPEPFAESAEHEPPAEPESAGSSEPEPPAESFEFEPPADSAEPESPPQSSEPDGPTEAFEPSPPDPEPGRRDDEGGWRNDDREWRSDG